MSQQSEPEPRDLAAEIERDVHDMFERLFVVPNGPFWPGEHYEFLPGEDERVGFLPDETFGRMGLVLARRTDEQPFAAMRWQWRGIHAADASKPDGTPLLRSTGNWVTVEGITTLEITGATMDGETVVGGETRPRRFIDWLSVYAQLGFVIEGRPVGMQATEVRSARTYRR